eukprot:354283-Chlamydomonas_euryale.AAC.1
MSIALAMRGSRPTPSYPWPACTSANLGPPLPPSPSDPQPAADPPRPPSPSHPAPVADLVGARPAEDLRLHHLL